MHHLPNISSKEKVVYINARIIDPKTGYDKIGQLFTIGEYIEDFGESVFSSGIPEDIKIIDCKNNILCPGLIDLQVHFRDPGQTNKEDIESGSKSAVSGGITTVVCQPNTNPVLDSSLSLEYLRLKSQEKAYCNIKCYGAVTCGMKGEVLTDMSNLKSLGAVGFTDDGLPVMNSHIMRKAMEYSNFLNVPIAQHAEDLNLTNSGCINEGLISLDLGVRGIPNISESVIVKRDISILEAVGGHYHLLHASTKESIEEIRIAKNKGLKVTVEVAPHHFTLTDNAVLDFGTDAKMNPPLRSEKDKQILIEAIEDGIIDAIATDHAPHEAASKNTSLEKAAFGIVGLETLLPLTLELHHKYNISLINLLGKLTYQPADIISLDRGRLKKGKKADLVLFDLNKEWEIDKNKFHSKSQNTPFHKRKVKGKVIKTIVSGSVVYEEDC